MSFRVSGRGGSQARTARRRPYRRCRCRLVKLRDLGLFVGNVGDRLDACLRRSQVVGKVGESLRSGVAGDAKEMGRRERERRSLTPEAARQSSRRAERQRTSLCATARRTRARLCAQPCDPGGDAAAPAVWTTVRLPTSSGEEQTHQTRRQRHRSLSPSRTILGVYRRRVR